MSPIFLNIFLLILSFSNILTQNEERNKDLHRSLLPNPILNSTTKGTASLKLHSKLLQTVYSDSYSKNFYYTTLYVGDNKVRQTYVIDTGSTIMASPCSPCAECGTHKNPFYYDLNRSHKPLKCSSSICKLTPASNCFTKKLKLLPSNTCSFQIRREDEDGIAGYYMRDIVYMETDRRVNNSVFHRKIYRSYSLPVGCTTKESGKYKTLNTDGIMGMNNDPKSFISLLYNLKIINQNIFTLCFGLRGGYMSLGEIDKTYHKQDTIEYVTLLSSNVYYLIKLDSIQFEDITPHSILKGSVIASIETGNTISYFPSPIFKSIINSFKAFCDEKVGRCGNFTYDSDLGYCAPFPDRESLFKAVFNYWPNITLYFGKAKYTWMPINYYYYYFKKDVRKACLGFDYHSSDRVILGANFIHGYDIIFDRKNQKLGFVLSDCSRSNLIWHKYFGVLGMKVPEFQTTDPILMDKELHHGEAENKFHFGDINKIDMVDFIEGHNTELDKKEFTTINFIILVTSIVIVIVVVMIVLLVLFCGKKKLTYEEQHQDTEYSIDDQPQEINNSDENMPDPNNNKISFEENNTPEVNLEDNK
jgi:cell division protein FtsL